jgi:hypothetical protein
MCASHDARDGIIDDGESDIDCGGHSTDGAPLCVDGKTCADSTDCMNGFCAPSMTCVMPTSSDGTKNGTETDVDCGGGAPTNAPQCRPGQGCKVDTDCQKYRSYLSSNGVCNDAGICAYGPSCRHADGGYSCGPTKDQDCCKSPAVAGQAATIDAYKITAGRMREFTNKVTGNVAGWYLANRANLPAAVRNQLDPYLDSVTGVTNDVILPSDLHSYPWGVDYQLGGTIYTGNYPSIVQGCYVGPKNSFAEGSHTYDNGAAEGDVRGYTTGYLDRLPINCVTYVMLAAFCAWDGGRLSTRDEHIAIGVNGLDGKTWAWGDSPTLGGWAWDTDNDIVGPATSGFLFAFDAKGTRINDCPTCDLQVANWQQVYLHVRFDPNASSVGGGYITPPMDPNVPLRDVPVNFDFITSDLAGAKISPPGRFPYDSYPAGTDLTTKTHYDVMGLMLEMHEASGTTATNVQQDCASCLDFGGDCVCNDTFCSSNADCITNNCCLPTSDNWNAAAGNCDGLAFPYNGHPAALSSCQGWNSEPQNFWNGGSWEGHAFKGAYAEPMMTKYGKTTGRCARD